MTTATPGRRNPHTREEVAAVIGAARQLWQSENRALSTQAELIWGDERENGKTLDLSSLIASDRGMKKAWSGPELCLMAGVPWPRTHPRAVPRPDWLGLCQTNKSADPYPNLFNAALALEHDEDFAGRLGFDEMLQQPVIIRAIPTVGPDNAVIEDEHLVALHHAMQRKGLPKMGIDTLHEAVRFIASRNKFHPLRAKLDTLEWDEQLRLSKWLTTYLGAPDDEYHRAVGSMFLVGMIARLYQPGCKMDYMPVLEGPQGALKSTAVELLACGYYSDDLPDLSSNDAVRASQHLRGKWIVEISDWASFRRTDVLRLKSFLSRKVEIYTPKYGRSEVHEPRQCVFVGTINKKTYLLDETGGRRFWPVICGTIDLEALTRDRDQLLAEAKDAYESGTQWWPDRTFEQEHIKPVQEERFEHDPWLEVISQYFSDYPTTSTTILKVATSILKLDTARIGTLDHRRIAACLELLDWTRGKKQNFGVPWFPPGKSLL